MITWGARIIDTYGRKFIYHINVQLSQVESLRSFLDKESQPGGLLSEYMQDIPGIMIDSSPVDIDYDQQPQDDTQPSCHFSLETYSETDYDIFCESLTTQYGCENAKLCVGSSSVYDYLCSSYNGDKNLCSSSPYCVVSTMYRCEWY